MQLCDACQRLMQVHFYFLFHTTHVPFVWGSWMMVEKLCNTVVRDSWNGKCPRLAVPRACSQTCVAENLGDLLMDLSFFGFSVIGKAFVTSAK